MGLPLALRQPRRQAPAWPRLLASGTSGHRLPRRGDDEAIVAVIRGQAHQLLDGASIWWTLDCAGSPILDGSRDFGSENVDLAACRNPRIRILRRVGDDVITLRALKRADDRAS